MKNASIEQTLKDSEQVLKEQYNFSTLDKPPDAQINARMEAEVLLAFTLKKSRTYLRTYPQQGIDPAVLGQFDKLIARRTKGEPVAYITGQREFWSMELITNEETLIPRPETELLVELALEKISQKNATHIAEIGTGTGAIALAIAREKPDCTVIAIDISQNALNVAKQNATRYALNNLHFHCGSWFEPVANDTFDIIISNPPYVAEDDPHLQQGDLRFEPLIALESGPDGLDAIRHLILKGQNRLAKGGWLLMEHGYDQREKIITLLHDAGYTNLSWHDDIYKLPRVILGQKE